MSKKKPTPVRRKQDHQERFSIRIQGGKTGLVEATSRMDISEFRIFATVLTMILPTDEDFAEYEVRVQDILKLFGLKNDGRYYEIFKDAALRLMDRRFVIFENKEDGQEYKTTIPLSIASSEPVKIGEQNRIRIQFHPKLKPYLLDLQREYLTIDIRNIADIQSHYSVKMYFILKHQQRLGNKVVKYEVSRLRQILGIEDHEYPLYGNFKQKVIKKGIEDINSFTDLMISKIDEHKVIRSIDAITFYISAQEQVKFIDNLPQKTPQQVVKSSENSRKVLDTISSENFLIGNSVEDSVEDSVSNPIEEIFESVKAFGVARSTVESWFTNYPNEQIKLGVAYVLDKIKRGEKIHNMGGYFNQMVKTTSLLETSQEEDEIGAAKKEQEDKAKQEARIAQINKAEEEKKQARYYQAKKAQIYTIFETNPTLSHLFMQELRAKRAAETPSFIVQMAYDNYKKVVEFEPDSKEEVLHNFENGGSFGAYLLDYLENKFEDIFAKLKV